MSCRQTAGFGRHVARLEELERRADGIAGDTYGARWALDVVEGKDVRVIRVDPPVTGNQVVAGGGVPARVEGPSGSGGVDVVGTSGTDAGGCGRLHRSREVIGLQLHLHVGGVEVDHDDGRLAVDTA
jgi:hypothetical protein